MKPTREQIIQNVYDNRIIAIVRGMEPKHCVKLAQALYEGGINMVEITFNQKSADHFEATTNAIRAISEQLAEQVMVGAGTVLTKEQVDLAKEAGALYIITPSTNPEVIRYAKEQGMVTMPGAMTPSEIVTAYEAGADFVKIFPVGNLGAAYIKAVKAPMSHIPVLAVGGVNEKNIAGFIKAGAIGAGVGGNLVNAQWIQNGEFDKITALAREFITNAKEA
ncbi:bifunctional 4-hydroxy-2-oxoglutarate aldolase/2-dehydro-3-deoxy-phosphogluconate aldolase [Petralouisia muris]|uniref:Bifunctional 4-hydroxy-2-oxoglutarate aldolase/2-dehydro-3-deoxy-phosphogluconate aldolase n=1 Tax=Petralouisia muris TaxID=3032872 RepID=A0AC61S0K6_9FIRM|nr:bifunctional 4-hydroxy-2-oxoglutarate aldolase/2-dehydro-3-deoxy-phosphogluconate aldolase [Petralouisia muris]TGY97912.1 bifunctional 4-hydroxy-2-oxoglutarate aldolase/2-dehydro-3-deoxy-phosphogluconate aldolase [Petralouisia muris]